MHAAYRQRLEVFCRKQGLRSVRALAAYTAKLGLPAIARCARIPENELRDHLAPHAEVLSQVCNFSVNLHFTGLVRSNRALAKPGVELLQPIGNDFPESFEIEAPLISEEDDQGQIGSCVGWGGKNIAEILVRQAQSADNFLANPSWLYGRIKARSGSTSHGATLEELASVLREDGIATWDSMPVHRDAPEDNPGNLPLPDKAKEDAQQRQVKDMFWMNGWKQGEVQALLSGAYELEPSRPLAIVFGATIYESLFNAQTAEDGIVPMPLEDECDRVLGGHCMVIIGWIHLDGELYLKIKNSWGLQFGDQGYLYFPLRYAQEHFFEGFVCHTLVQENQTQRRLSSAIAPLAWGGITLLIFAIGFLFLDRNIRFTNWLNLQAVEVPSKNTSKPAKEDKSSENLNLSPAKAPSSIEISNNKVQVDDRDPIEIYLDIIHSFETTNPPRKPI